MSAKTQKPKSVRLNGMSVAPPGADIRQFARHGSIETCTRSNLLDARTTSLCPLKGGDLFAIRDRRRAPSRRERL